MGWSLQLKVIERIRNEIDIVKIISQSLSLIKKGNNYISLCPFHDDQNPSLVISAQKQIFKCFSCGKGGDVITFISNYQKISFQASIKLLAEILGIEFKFKEEKVVFNPKEQILLDLLNDANNFFMNSIMLPEHKNVWQYAHSRGLDSKIIEKFKIGFCPNETFIKYLKNKNYDEAQLLNASLIDRNYESFFKNRLTFAIENTNGNIIGFSGRSLEQDNEIKYLNSAESLIFSKNKTLYNWFNAIETIEKSGEVFIVEGFMDVIAFYKVGILNTIALMGTNFSSFQTELLKNFKVILMLDQDQAGLKASLKIIQKLVKNKIHVEVIKNDTNLDPDEIFLDDNGKKLINLIQERFSWIEYVYDIFLPKNEVKDVNVIKTFIKNFRNFLSLSNELEQEFYINKISIYFNISKQTLMKTLNFSSIKFNQNDENKLKLSAQTKNFKNKFEIKAKNYHHLVIRSMLKNANLIKIFQASNLNFHDKLLNDIANLFHLYPKIPSMKPEIKQKCSEILNESDEIAHSELEFKDYIERIKWMNNYKISQKIIDSIKKINDPKIALKLLEEQIKLKRGK